LSFLELAIEKCRDSAPAWELENSIADGLFAQYDSLPEVPIRPGVGPFLSAASDLIEGFSGTMGGQAAVEILSSCYEAVMLSQLTGVLTVQMQEENSQCRRAIELQKELLLEYISMP
jgi:hypothetical protein